ncbi:MAG: 4-hydroxy-tetrahydrodipicolinate synthase [Flavobacteriaceae bacterium]|nr:4-hydroxy-tetrahydrodipicolinate synthase [Flavobacteriaceae bacterium]
MNLKGHGVAVITPFDNKGSIDFSSLEKHINKLILSNIDYLVVLGTTSEAATLSISEQIKISEFIVQINNKRVPLVIGVGGNDTRSVIDKLNKFKLSDFQSILSVCPYYNLPTQSGLFEHFSEISRNSHIPLILYNVPSRTGSNIKPSTVFQLIKKQNNIIGIKEASNNKDQINELLHFSPNNFQIVSGDDLTAANSILKGTVGVISVIGNALPFEFNQIVKYSISNQNRKALSKQSELMNLINLIFEEGNPSGIKALMSELGMCENNLRLPLVSVSNELLIRIKNELKSFVLT